MPTLRQRAAARTEQLRSQIPLNLYLGLLHQGAVEGKLPVLDPFTCQEKSGSVAADLSPNQRLEILKYMTDKVMPTKVDISHTAVEPDDLDQITDQELAALPTDQLQELIANTRDELEHHENALDKSAFPGTAGHAQPDLGSVPQLPNRDRVNTASVSILPDEPASATADTPP